MRKIFLPLFMVVSTCLVAGEATFNGTGTSSREPEFVTVNLTVRSQCYASPLEAMKANNAAVSEVQNILSQWFEEGRDQLFTNGGFTSEYSETIYYGSNSKTVCQGTFQQQTNIKFKTDYVGGFSECYSSIQQEVLAKFTRGVQGTHTTYVTINEPVGGVCDQTLRVMEQEAYARAMSHAKDKFRACGEVCGLDDEANIVSFGDIENYSVTPSYKSFRSVPESAGPVVINFEPTQVSANVKVRFVYGEATSRSPKRSRIDQ